MSQITGQIGQRFEYVGVFEDFTARQCEAVEFAAQVVIQQDVDIERAIGEFGQVAAAAVLIFEFGQPVFELAGAHIGLDACAGVQKIVAAETDGFGLVDRR